jgi:hypothetical protein
MIIHNKLDKSFGPVGSIVGLILFFTGFILVWYSSVSIVNILVGALVGFTHSSTEIDLGLKKIRHSDLLFGILRTGKWIQIKPEMKVGILKSRKTWRTFSAGNRQLDTPVEDYRLVLFNASGKKLMPVKKFDDLNAARKEQDNICEQLKICKM